MGWYILLGQVRQVQVGFIDARLLKQHRWFPQARHDHPTRTAVQATRAPYVDGRSKRGGWTAPPCFGDGHRRAYAKSPSGVIAGRNNSSPTPLLWIGTDDERHIVIKFMMQRFHCRKERIKVAVNQHARPCCLNRPRLLNHNQSSTPAVFEVDDGSVQVEGCSQA